MTVHNQPGVECLAMKWSRRFAVLSAIGTLLCFADPKVVTQQAARVEVSSGPCTLDDFPAGTTLFPVRGRVIDDLTGAGISGVTVRLTSGCRPDRVRTLAALMNQETVTDKDGGFGFQDVPAISVSIVADEGNRSYLELWPFRHRVDDPIGIYTIGPDSTSIILRLAPAASISGLVRDEHGAPIGDAWISLFAYRTWEGWPRLEFWNAVKTNLDGSYHRESLPPGRYYLVASPDPYRSGVPFTHDKPGNAVGLVPVRFPVQPEAQDEDAFFDLAEGQQMKVDFVLAPHILHHVMGRTEGRSNGAALLSVIGSNGGQYFFNVPTFCCRFDAWVPNGRFRLAADFTSADGSFTASQPLQVNGADVSDVVVWVARKAETPIPIQVTVSPSRRPSCLDSQIRCAFLDVLFIRHMDNGYFEVGAQRETLLEPRQDGTFPIQSVMLLPGTYSVAVNTLLNVYAESMVRDSTDLMSEPLVVKPQDSGHPIQLVIAEGAVIEGTTTSTGKATKALVYAIPERPDGRLFQPVASDGQGKFHLQGLAPAEYTLFATGVELGINLRSREEIEYWRANGQHIKAELGNSSVVELQPSLVPGQLYPTEADPIH